MYIVTPRCKIRTVYGEGCVYMDTPLCKIRIVYGASSRVRYALYIQLYIYGVSTRRTDVCTHIYTQTLCISQVVWVYRGHQSVYLTHPIACVALGVAFVALGEVDLIWNCLRLLLPLRTMPSSTLTPPPMLPFLPNTYAQHVVGEKRRVLEAYTLQGGVFISTPFRVGSSDTPNICSVSRREKHDNTLAILGG